MIQDVLTHLGGVGGYGVVSLCLFFAAFVGILIWMLRLTRPYLDSMRTLPLEDEATTDPDGGRVETLDERPCSVSTLQGVRAPEHAKAWTPNRVARSTVPMCARNEPEASHE